MAGVSNREEGLVTGGATGEGPSYWGGGVVEGEILCIAQKG